MIRNIFEAIYDFPRTFLAWVLFHLASWMDMRVVPNDTEDVMDDFIDQIFEELKDVDIKDIDDW